MRWKIHAIVIGSITLLLLILYWVSQVTVEPKTIVKNLGDQYIRIDQAHWGLNCNRNYEEYMRAKRLGKLQLEEGEDAEPLEEPKPVSANNILPQLSKLCDVQATCEFDANIVTFGNPYKNCLKELKVTYRCTSYDRLHQLSVYEGEHVKIDCQNSTAPAKTPAAQ